jgi:hypothetical protein
VEFDLSGVFTGDLPEEGAGKQVEHLFGALVVVLAVALLLGLGSGVFDESLDLRGLDLLLGLADRLSGLLDLSPDLALRGVDDFVKAVAFELFKCVVAPEGVVVAVGGELRIDGTLHEGLGFGGLAGLLGEEAYARESDAEGEGRVRKKAGLHTICDAEA